jgi:hypothetical protein
MPLIMAWDAMIVARMESSRNGMLGEDHLEQDVLRPRMGQQERTLPEIVQDQRAEHKIPSADDRLPAQVPHVGIERLSPGRAENHLGQDEEPREAAVEQEPERIGGVDGLDHRRHLGDGGKAGDGQHREPEQHDRTERPGDLFRPLLLEPEQGEGDEARNEDERIPAGPLQPRDQQGAFHGGQDTDGRRDDPVSDEERDADVGEQGNEPGLPSRLEERAQQFGQHDDAAFAAFSELHGQPCVLDRYEEDQGPEDQGQDADDAALRRLGEQENDGQRVDRTGSDVAEHEPE